MYDALVRKDTEYEGIFFAAIKTTGIFCRPTCTARKPLQKNVEFYFSVKQALDNGYRPCKVCKPLNIVQDFPDYIKRTLNFLEQNEFQKMTDYTLHKLGIEPNRVRRWFKKNHGMTFQSYQRMIRINSAFKKLKSGDSATGTAFDTGYESLSGFNDAYKSVLKSTPSKNHTTNVIDIKRISSPLGPMFIAGTEDGICLVEFTDRRMLESEFKDLSKRLNAEIVYGENKYFADCEKQLGEYFSGKRKEFNIPLVTPGTDFRVKVWNELKKIPYGKTISYKQQAINIGKPEAVRAVASANGHNRIAIIIPCHRVIGESGHLTGYGGGVWRKKWLLDLETENV